jgi:hypothetical protein
MLVTEVFQYLLGESGDDLTAVPPIVLAFTGLFILQGLKAEVRLSTPSSSRPTGREFVRAGNRTAFPRLPRPGGSVPGAHLPPFPCSDSAKQGLTLRRGYGQVKRTSPFPHGWAASAWLAMACPAGGKR